MPASGILIAIHRLLRRVDLGTRFPLPLDAFKAPLERAIGLKPVGIEISVRRAVHGALQQCEIDGLRICPVLPFLLTEFVSIFLQLEGGDLRRSGGGVGSAEVKPVDVEPPTRFMKRQPRSAYSIRAVGAAKEPVEKRLRDPREPAESIAPIAAIVRSRSAHA